MFVAFSMIDFRFCLFQIYLWHLSPEESLLSVFDQQEETVCEQTPSWTGHSSKACSVGWTSTPQPLVECGCPLCSSLGSWCLWWRLRRCGEMSRKTSHATRLSQDATTFAMTTSSQCPMSGCGPCSSSLSPAPRSWWWCMWPTGKKGRKSTGKSMAKTVADFTWTLGRNAEVYGGPTSSRCFSK